MNRIALTLAASSLALGAGLFTDAGVLGASPAAAQTRGNGDAARLHARASQAIAQGVLPQAIELLEQAVALAPRDAGYRLLLADSYMRSGRFQSAETTYRDVTEIDPSQSRAGIALALMQVANGRAEAALAELERIERDAAAADVGLAFALAGAPQRAIEVLEPAARAVSATPRTRQNLALAYALGGDWQQARTVAAQDIAPGELAERMAQWARFSHQAGSAEPVQALLGVNAAADSGQPVQIAMRAPSPNRESGTRTALAAVEVEAPAPVAPVAQTAPTVVAEVIPMPTDAPSAAQPAPVVLASAEPVGEPVQIEAPAPVETAMAADELETADWGVSEQGEVELPAEEAQQAPVPVRVQYAVAAENLVRADATVMRVENRNVRTVAAAAARPVAGRLPGKRASGGEFVVQIGAFSSAQNADRAWQHYQNSYGLRAERPVTMTIDHEGQLLHRVAVSGFEKRADATRACETIKARGGACFVRNTAGDASVDWAARYAGSENGEA